MGAMPLAELALFCPWGLGVGVAGWLRGAAVAVTAGFGGTVGAAVG